MITEIFTMLSSVSVSSKGGNTRIDISPTHSRIRSITSYSSNTIFYFPTIVSDQITPEEMAMCSRTLEKSYASFVVACISLMPFHRVKADDQASIESYLAQFHQNIGISGGNSSVVMGKVLDLVDTLPTNEDASGIQITQDDINTTADFLMECWEKSRRNCSDFIKIVEHTVPINEMFSKDPVDPVTRTMQAKYLATLDEMETWGFVGEATAEMFDNYEGLENLSDADIIQSMFSGSEDDDDEDDIDDDLYPELDELLGEASGANLNEGNVKSAVNSIMFSLEAVSENKIKSCSSLTKLRSLEAKLNKLKNKYANYLTRYKRKYKENKENNKKSKLSIRFNGQMISNPKAFMKEYGAYIKIINKRLKLVEKRRAELRKRKGLPTDGGSGSMKIEENAVGDLTDFDLRSIDLCIETVDRWLSAPDEVVFVLTEGKNDYWRREAERAQSIAYDEYQRAQRAEDNNVAMAKELERQKRAFDGLHSETKRQKDGRLKAEHSNALLSQRNTRLEKKLKEQTDLSEKEKQELLDQLKAAKENGQSQQAGPVTPVVTSHRTFDDKVFTDMDMKKANEAIPTFAKATIGFVIDGTDQVVNRDVLVGVKVNVHKVPAMELISDIYNCLINKRKFLKFVKWISGEEKSLADLLFGIKELKMDATNSRNGGAATWTTAFRRRKRWANMSVPYLMKEYTPNGTVILTMNEVQYIRDEYGLDIMRPDHVQMLMNASFLLGFVILDQANEMMYITYDGHGGNFQQYTYAMMEREANNSDRMMREIYRAMSR